MQKKELTPLKHRLLFYALVYPVLIGFFFYSDPLLKDSNPNAWFNLAGFIFFEILMTFGVMQLMDLFVTRRRETDPWI